MITMPTLPLAVECHHFALAALGFNYSIAFKFLSWATVVPIVISGLQRRVITCWGLSLVKSLEAKRGGGGGSWGDSTSSCKPLYFTVYSSGNAGFPLRWRGEWPTPLRVGRLLPLAKQTHQNLEFNVPSIISVFPHMPVPMYRIFLVSSQCPTLTVNTLQVCKFNLGWL